MRQDLETHQRHADEIADPLGLDQPHRLGRVPFGHQHQLAAHRERLEHHRHFGGDVEQRHVEQGRRLALGRLAVLGREAEHHQRLREIVEHRLQHRAMIAERALRTARSSREVNRIVARSSGPSSGKSAAASDRDRRERLARAAGDRRSPRPSRSAPRPRPAALPRGGSANTMRAFDLGQRGGEFLRLPPAVEQHRDPARHQRCPCTARSTTANCASRCRRGRRAPARPRPARSRRRCACGIDLRRRSAARRPTPGKSRRHARRNNARNNARGWAARRRSRDRSARRPSLRPAPSARSAPVSLPIPASIRPSSTLGIALSTWSCRLDASYGGAKPRGKALILHALTAIDFNDLHLSKVLLHIHLFGRDLFDIKWYSIAYIAGIVVGWWYLMRLLARAGRADGEPPCRGSGVLRDARHHPGRAARLRAVLRAEHVPARRSASSSCGTAACRSTAA